MDNKEIKRRLIDLKETVGFIETLDRKIKNDIVDVGEDFVVVHSHQAGSINRRIAFDKIHKAETATPHGCVTRALAHHLGLL
jgi:hypothetical protein